MQITRLTGKACQTTRPLWEEVFSEDSEQFTDYYYAHKAEGNIGYALGEEPYEAMLFLTPYEVEIYGKNRTLFYLVGVATRPEARRQGKMAALLTASMQEMYRKRQPFAFLMPADPAIYEPFGFSYVYERKEWEFRDKRFAREGLEPLMGTGEGSLLSLRGLAGKGTEKQEWCERLASFANRVLKNRYEIYVRRDAAYYDSLLAQMKAQDGDIFLLLRQGRLAGYFFYAREGEEAVLQEVVEEEEGSFFFFREKEEKKPVIMARIIHLEEMLKLVRSETNKTLLLQVKDALLPENEGLFLWETTPEGSRVTRLREDRKPEASLSVKELAPYLLRNVFLNEIV